LARTGQDVELIKPGVAVAAVGDVLELPGVEHPLAHHVDFLALLEAPGEASGELGQSHVRPRLARAGVRWGRRRALRGRLRRHALVGDRRGGLSRGALAGGLGLLEPLSTLLDPPRQLLGRSPIRAVLGNLVQQRIHLGHRRIAERVVQLGGVELAEQLVGLGILLGRLRPPGAAAHHQHRDGAEDSRADSDRVFHSYTPRKRRLPKLSASCASKIFCADFSMSYSTLKYSTVLAVVSQMTKQARLS